MAFSKTELERVSKLAEKNRAEPQGLFIDRGIMRSLQNNYNIKFKPLAGKKPDLQKPMREKGGMR